jgi:hypothetical protein
MIVDGDEQELGADGLDPIAAVAGDAAGCAPRA